MKVIKYIISTFIYIIILTNLIQSQTIPVNLRGRVVTYNKFIHRNVPVHFAGLELLRYDPGQNKWILDRTSNTNTHGYYFFYNIAPGRYKIIVKNKKSMVIEVNPASNSHQFQQIPDIII
ncbi:MAG: hypothetical protein P8X42_15885 [Calditrichaceae bacterium]|jgi:hypothetical protein